MRGHLKIMAFQLCAWSYAMVRTKSETCSFHKELQNMYFKSKEALMPLKVFAQDMVIFSAKTSIKSHSLCCGL